jgi:hypothetical protein
MLRTHGVVHVTALALGSASVLHQEAIPANLPS